MTTSKTFEVSSCTSSNFAASLRNPPKRSAPYHFIMELQKRVSSISVSTIVAAAFLPSDNTLSSKSPCVSCSARCSICFAVLLKGSCRSPDLVDIAEPSPPMGLGFCTMSPATLFCCSLSSLSHCSVAGRNCLRSGRNIISPAFILPLRKNDGT